MSPNKTFRLLVKTHNKTGLKYLCQTSRENFENYPGSGTYWTRHIKKHGKNFSTIVLGKYSTKKELKEAGIHYSELWQVDKSKEWANIVKESGVGGDTSSSPRYKKGMKNRKVLRGPDNPQYGKPGWINGKTYEEIYDADTICKIKAKQRAAQLGHSRNKGKTFDEIYGPKEAAKKRHKMSKSSKGQPSKLKGRKIGPHSEERKQNISKALTGRTISEERREKLRGRIPWNKGKSAAILVCPACGIQGGPPGIYRWHFNNCKTLNY